MLRLKLKLYTYHTFLVVPFVVLFLYAHNLSLSKLEMTYRTLFIGSAICLMFYGITQTILHNRLKTGVYVSLLLFGLFQYGVLYETLGILQNKGYWPFSHVHRFLLIFYGLLFAGLLIFFRKTKYDFVRVNYFLNFLLILLIIFNSGKIIFHSSSSSHQINKYADEPVVKFPEQATKPDLYYIILDGYASRPVLWKYYNYDNPSFYDGLSGIGYRFCDSAFSNYYSTTRSLCATLNMRFSDQQQDALEGLRNNRVFALLKENGYRIYHMQSGYVVSSSFAAADSVVGIGGPNEFELSLLKHTVLRLDDAFGFFALRRLRSQFKKLRSMADISTQPKFCFIHVVAPHPPFVLGKTGKANNTHLSDENLWEPEQQYLDQLEYVSEQIKEFLQYLHEKNPHAVVILQSDHGPYGPGKNAEEVFESRAGILYAYKAPMEIKIPSNSSSINTFPYFLNGLFGTRLAYLKDEEAGKEQFLKTPVLFKKLED